MTADTATACSPATRPASCSTPRLTRGRAANHLYLQAVATATRTAPSDPSHPPADRHRHPRDASWPATTPPLRHHHRTASTPTPPPGSAPPPPATPTPSRRRRTPPRHRRHRRRPRDRRRPVVPGLTDAPRLAHPARPPGPPRRRRHRPGSAALARRRQRPGARHRRRPPPPSSTGASTTPHAAGTRAAALAARRPRRPAPTTRLGRPTWPPAPTRQRPRRPRSRSQAATAPAPRLGPPRTGPPRRPELLGDIAVWRAAIASPTPTSAPPDPPSSPPAPPRWQHQLTPPRRAAPPRWPSGPASALWPPPPDATPSPRSSPNGSPRSPAPASTPPPPAPRAGRGPAAGRPRRRALWWRIHATCPTPTTSTEPASAGVARSGRRHGGPRSRHAGPDEPRRSAANERRMHPGPGTTSHADRGSTR